MVRGGGLYRGQSKHTGGQFGEWLANLGFEASMIAPQSTVSLLAKCAGDNVVIVAYTRACLLAASQLADDRMSSRSHDSSISALQQQWYR